MRTFGPAILFVTSMIVVSASFAAESSVMVGAQGMLPSKHIVDNAVNSADHTTLVAAINVIDTVLMPK